MHIGKRRLTIVLLVAVAAISAVVGLLISRSGGERGRQLKEQAIQGTRIALVQRACQTGCVFIPLIVTNAGRTRQTNSSEAAAAINVLAQAGTSCDMGAVGPVAGARVTVITDHNTRVGVTDTDGRAFFEAADEAAVVQIEWPTGYFPCPNSRPVVEVPSGAGEVAFTATVSAYP